MPVHDQHPIIVVGGGFTGTLLAINLVRLGARVELVERDQAALAKGLAFGTRRSEHLLNVRASNMSAFADDPGHFLRWMGFSTHEQANRFVPRLAYGQYLREALLKTLSDAGTRLSIRSGEVADIEQADIEQADRAALVRLANGETIAGSAVVLAIGNLPARLPDVLAGLPAGLAASDPWAPAAIAGLQPDDPVLLIGTGLTAVDVILSLDDAGHRGPILALSRRGLKPRGHAESGPVIGTVTRPEARGAALLRAVRQRARLVGWRTAVDELRPHTRQLWQAHDRAGQARFLRHVRAWWDVHRHRLAPQVQARLDQIEAHGRLAFRGGRIVGVEVRGEGAGSRAIVEWRPRGNDFTVRTVAARVINCTGPEGDPARCGAPLLRHLLAKGLLRADAHGLGLDVAADGRVLDADGRPSDWLFAAGPLTKGAHWEIVAVPDIRHQVWDLARRLSGRQSQKG